MDLRSRLAQLETRLGVGRDRPPSPLDGERAAVPLSARLQRLGAAQADMPARRGGSQEGVAPVFGGALCADGVVLIDSFLPASRSHGRVPFHDIHEVSLAFLAGGEEPEREGLLFIDTETTGLAGGTGTVAFVLGLARIEDDVVHVRQYFLTSFTAEPAMLTQALAWICGASHLVSFNGKSFDIPLLVTRYRLPPIGTTLSRLSHLDLLHRTRAAFPKNWPDCRLPKAQPKS